MGHFPAAPSHLLCLVFLSGLIPNASAWFLVKTLIWAPVSIKNAKFTHFRHTGICIAGSLSVAHPEEFTVGSGGPGPETMAYRCFTLAAPPTEARQGEVSLPKGVQLTAPPSAPWFSPLAIPLAIPDAVGGLSVQHRSGYLKC